MNGTCDGCFVCLDGLEIHMLSGGANFGRGWLIGWCSAQGGGLSRFENHERSLPQIEINVVVRLMCDVATEVSP